MAPSSIPAPVRSLAECDELLTRPGLLVRTASCLRSELTVQHEMETREHRGYKQRYFKNLPASLRDFWLATKPFGARTYLIYEEETLSYDETHRRVVDLATCLRDRFGCRKGTRIALATKNIPEWVITFWATALLGATIVPLNAFMSPDALAHILKLTDSRVLIVDPERAAKLQGVVGALKLEAALVVRASSPPAGFRRLEDELKPFAGSSFDSLASVEIGADDEASVFSTSGTTGLPSACDASRTC